jgi:hypothetical protein
MAFHDTTKVPLNTVPIISKKGNLASIDVAENRPFHSWERLY